MFYFVSVCVLSNCFNKRKSHHILHKLISLKNATITNDEGNCASRGSLFQWIPWDSHGIHWNFRIMHTSTTHTIGGALTTYPPELSPQNSDFSPCECRYTLPHPIEKCHFPPSPGCTLALGRCTYNLPPELSPKILIFRPGGASEN